jgi:hypothetical protein
MTTEQISTSVALYFAPDRMRSVPMRWFEWVRELFRFYNLSPILFSADGQGFETGECYVLAIAGMDIIDNAGQRLVARQEDLISSIRNGHIVSLELDSPRSLSGGRSDWRAMTDVVLPDGNLFVGLDDCFADDPCRLLQVVFSVAAPLFDVRYGIAYKSRLSEKPDSYAIGATSLKFSELRGRIEARHSGRHVKSPDQLWQDELNGNRRHLVGLFRGAYRANVLSKAHVQNADLLSHRIGALSPLSGGLWLWELADDELPIAQAMLESKRLFVSQANP